MPPLPSGVSVLLPNSATLRKTTRFKSSKADVSGQIEGIARRVTLSVSPGDDERGAIAERDAPIGVRFSAQDLQLDLIEAAHGAVSVKLTDRIEELLLDIFSGEVCLIEPHFPLKGEVEKERFGARVCLTESGREALCITHLTVLHLLRE